MVFLLPFLRARALFFLSFFSLILLFTWLFFGRLEVLSLAKGEVVTKAKTQSIQHLEGGVIDSILVKTGDRVEVGDILLTLSPIQEQSKVSEINLRLAWLEAQKLRLEALLLGRKFEFSNNFATQYPELIEKEQKLLEAWDSKRKLNQKSAMAEIKHQEASLANERKKHAQLKAKLAISQEQLKMSEALFDKGSISKWQFLQKKQEMNEVELSLIEAESHVDLANRNLKEAKLKEQRFEEEDRLLLGKELEVIEREYHALREQKAHYDDRLERTVIKAPISGIVQELYVNTLGGVARSAEPLLDIVPTEQPLLIEAALPVQDVGYVRVGQLAKIRLSDSEGARFPPLLAKVVLLSPDTFLDKSGRAFYRIQIEPLQTSFKKGDIIYALHPGLEVDVFVLMGKRSVFSYLIGPLFQGVDTAFTEK